MNTAAPSPNPTEPLYQHRRFGGYHHSQLGRGGPGGKRMALIKVALIGTGVWLVAKNFRQ